MSSKELLREMRTLNERMDELTCAVSKIYALLDATLAEKRQTSDPASSCGSSLTNAVPRSTKNSRSTQSSASSTHAPTSSASSSTGLGASSHATHSSWTSQESQSTAYPETAGTFRSVQTKEYRSVASLAYASPSSTYVSPSSAYVSPSSASHVPWTGQSTKHSSTKSSQPSPSSSGSFSSYFTRLTNSYARRKKICFSRPPGETYSRNDEAMMERAVGIASNKVDVVDSMDAADLGVVWVIGHHGDRPLVDFDLDPQDDDSSSARKRLGALIPSLPSGRKILVIVAFLFREDFFPSDVARIEAVLKPLAGQVSVMLVRQHEVNFRYTYPIVGSPPEVLQDRNICDLESALTRFVTM